MGPVEIWAMGAMGMCPFSLYVSPPLSFVIIYAKITGPFSLSQRVVILTVYLYICQLLHMAQICFRKIDR